VFNNKHKKITDFSQVFLQPANSTHRQYEALRAFFVDHLSSKEAARRIGYSAGGFVFSHNFRQNPDRRFFIPPPKAPERHPKPIHCASRSFKPVNRISPSTIFRPAGQQT
jgi:hypothetical protein